MQRILVVEDNDEARQWMVKTVGVAFPETEVMQAENLAQGRKRLASSHFNLAVIDINLPDGCGIDLVRETAENYPDVYCVISTIFDDDEHIFSSLQAGARGYLLKGQPTERVVGQLRGIAHGDPPLSAAIARRVLRYFQHRPRLSCASGETSLSNREREVLTLVGKGYSRSEISGLLKISTNTAASYIKTIYQKLNISSRAEAALEAVRLGLIHPNL